MTREKLKFDEDTDRLHGEWNYEYLRNAAGEFGAPLFVFSPKLLENSYRSIINAFQSVNLNSEIFFSVKTNPVAAVLRKVFELGAGAEVVNEYEFWLVKKLGLPPDKIILNGNVKTDSLLEQAIDYEVGLLCAESVEEIHRIAEISNRLGKNVNLSIRINPGLRSGLLDFTLLSGSSGHGGGIVADTSELAESIELLSANSNLKLKGLNIHIGSGINSVNPYKYAIRKTAEVRNKFLSRGFSIEVLDIGGGFGIENVDEINLWQAVCSFGFNKSWKAKSKCRKDLFREIAEYITEEFGGNTFNGQKKPLTIYLEPGRALVGHSHVLLLRAEKVAAGKRKTVYCNGGAMNISPLLLSEYHEIKNLTASASDEIYEYDIMGSMPTPLDLIAKQRKLKKVSKGDIIAVFDTGAYFTPFNNTFAGPRPAIVQLDNGRFTIIRERESFDDLIN